MEHTIKIIAALALFVVLIVVGALYLSGLGAAHGGGKITTVPVTTSITTTTISFTTPTTSIPVNSSIVENLLVSGTISVTGYGMNVTRIAFYGTNSNLTYSAKITDGKYSLDLPNLKTYDVVVFWAGPYPWQTGWEPIKPNVWPFVLGLVNETSATYNATLTLPDSMIKINGSIRMTPPNVTPSGVVLRYPTEVIFRAPGGMKFTGNVSTYSLTNPYTNSTYYLYNYTMSVPNLETYNVTIKWKGQYSTYGYCYENSTSIYEAVGVVNQTENYVC